MNFDPENPNWTAFALGELPAEEAKAYEEEVKTNPQAAAFVSEVRAFSKQLESSLEQKAVGLNLNNVNSLKKKP